MRQAGPLKQESRLQSVTVQHDADSGRSVDATWLEKRDVG